MARLFIQEKDNIWCDIMDVSTRERQTASQRRIIRERAEHTLLAKGTSKDQFESRGVRTWLRVHISEVRERKAAETHQKIARSPKRTVEEKVAMSPETINRCVELGMLSEQEFQAESRRAEGFLGQMRRPRR